MKTLTHCLLALVLTCLGLHKLSFAQAPIVLSSADAPLVFELPLDASTTQSLTQATAVQLATRAQHSAQGMTYPAWLSDATFSVTNRPRQRLAIVISPKRGNPELSTELLLTINNAGRRSFKPLHLMFDEKSTFAGAPMPAALQHAVDSGFTSALKTKAPLDFSTLAITAAQAPVASTYAVPPPDTDNHANVSLPPIPSETNRPQATVKSQQSTRSEAKVARAPEFSTSKIAAAPQATPDKPFQSAVPVAQAISGLQPTPNVVPAAPAPPASPTRSAPAPQKAIQAQSSWLADWPLLAGAITALALLLYLAVRLWRARSKRPDFAATLSPTEQAASTVFGLSDEEATDAHKRWLSQQILQKNNK